LAHSGLNLFFCNFFGHTNLRIPPQQSQSRLLGWANGWLR